MQQYELAIRRVQQLLRGRQMLTLLTIIGAGAAFSLAALARSRSTDATPDRLTDI